MRVIKLIVDSTSAGADVFADSQGWTSLLERITVHSLLGSLSFNSSTACLFVSLPKQAETKALQEFYEAAGASAVTGKGKNEEAVAKAKRGMLLSPPRCAAAEPCGVTRSARHGGDRESMLAAEGPHALPPCRHWQLHKPQRRCAAWPRGPHRRVP